MSGPEHPGPGPEHPGVGPAGEPDARRMRLARLHHVTGVCSDLARTTAFYRDVLGLALLREGHNDDDPDARHFWFGEPGGDGILVSFMEYPALEPGRVGVGSTHHFAFAVGSAEELDAWREHLRDPDGHVVEIATPAG